MKFRHSGQDIIAGSFIVILTSATQTANIKTLEYGIGEDIGFIITNLGSEYDKILGSNNNLIYLWSTERPILMGSTHLFNECSSSTQSIWRQGCAFILDHSNMDSGIM